MKDALKDFIEACKPNGHYVFMHPKYTNGTCDWRNCKYPWWSGIAGFISHWNVIGRRIGHCIHYRHGWCRTDVDHMFGKMRPLKVTWYVFKAIFCLLFLQWRRTNGYEDVEVAGWGFSTDYYGEACGTVITVGCGVFDGWFVSEHSI